MNPSLIKKAAALVSRVVARRDGSYQVAGGSDTYTITFPKPGAFGFGGRPACSCPANLSGKQCSHLLAVQFYREHKARTYSDANRQKVNL